MKRKWIALYLPYSREPVPKTYFDTEDNGYDWLYSDALCHMCKKELEEHGDDALLPCTAEYMIYQETFFEMIKREFVNLFRKNKK